MYCSRCAHYNDGYCRRFTKLVGHFERPCGKFTTMDNITRKCRECGQELPIDQFTKNRYGVTSLCKDCFRKKMQRKTEPQVAGILQEEQKWQSDKNVPLSTEKPAMLPPRLSTYTDEELIEELRKRGYVGSLRKEITLTPIF